MYKNISKTILGIVGLTGIAILDNFLIIAVAVLIHFSVYFIVGFLYRLNIISGTLMGKLCYFLIWITVLGGIVFFVLNC